MDSHIREVEINGVLFKPHPGINYKFDYVKAYDKTKKSKGDLSFYRWLCLNDLFFLVYFVIGVQGDSRANHPYIVGACQDVENGPKTRTLDLWFREGFKSTIVSKAETIQAILKNPEERCAIFSYSKEAARAIMRPIKDTFEKNRFLKDCFPDVLYENPAGEAFKWSEDEGIFLKRKGSYTESTLEACGLIKGMPTGRHYTRRVYDDIMVQDLVDSPAMVAQLKEKFDISENLGLDGGVERIVGTIYAYDDVLTYIRDKINPITKERIYHTRIKPATHDGSFSGTSVFISEARLQILKSNPRTFAAQQLLNPSPEELAKLNYKNITTVSKSGLPKHLFRFMSIDPAGDHSVRGKLQDPWGIVVFGVEGVRDDAGFSRVYILDLCIEVMTIEQALKTVVDMYCRNGRILRVGVEKVGMSTMEVHISKALLARGRCVTKENRSLVSLTSRGRSKEYRIESNLCWPLNNGTIFMLEDVPSHYAQALRKEMEDFPNGRNDGIDALAYAYDMIADYRFGAKPGEDVDPTQDKYSVVTRDPNRFGWMKV